MGSTIMFSAILSLCLFGDHVFRVFLGSTAMILGVQWASYSQAFLRFFLFFISPGVWGWSLEQSENSRKIRTLAE